MKYCYTICFATALQQPALQNLERGDTTLLYDMLCNNCSRPAVATHRAGTGFRQRSGRAPWWLSVSSHLQCQTITSAIAVVHRAPAIQPAFCHKFAAPRKRRKAGTAEWPTARLLPAQLWQVGIIAYDLHLHQRLCCLPAAAALRSRPSAGTPESDKILVER